MCQDSTAPKIIAEGVEEKAQADLLAEMGVKYAPGQFLRPRRAPHRLCGQINPKIC
jgi:EAL domain-containing protein (putative c-di-GMP-specific phosphodiesterase class I)